MADIWVNIVVVSVTFAIFFVIIRQIRPPRKLVYNGEALICISSGKVFDNEQLYFNSQGIFVYCGKVLRTQHGFEEVVALQKSGIGVNHAKVWKLVVQQNGRTICYRFRLFLVFPDSPAP